MGLSLPLDKFSFGYPTDSTVEIVIHPDIDEPSRRWQFWQFRPRPEYLTAICVDRIGDDPPDFIVREVIPLAGEKTLAPEFLRKSK
jgi:4'-phosphopantetheinyl transferase